MIYVIVGNGIAGLSAAEEIRKNDNDGRIIVISEEKYLTYNRVKLSHFISKEDYTLKDLMIKDEKWYKDREIEVLLNTEVIKIDSENKEVVAKSIDNQDNIKYDKLLIANGSSPFIPPIKGIDSKGVFSLRTIDDLKEIQRYIKKCSSISVIGGGLLGIEAAWALKQAKKEVNVIEFWPYLLPRQMDEELGEYLRIHLEKEGLKFYLKSVGEEIHSDGKARNIRLKDGNIIYSDAVLISTGIRPNVDIAKGTSLKVERGILVDKYMRTNIEDIYAAGDIAEIDGVVLGLWSAAMDQGKIAGSNMTGAEKEYRISKPTTALIIGDTKMFSTGNIDRADTDMKIQGENYFHKLFMKKEKLIGGVLIGDITKMIALKKAVSENRDLTHMLEKGASASEILNSL